MSAACAATGADMWANVESFTAAFQPAPFDRLLQQITTAQAATRNLVTYEFSSFWMADGPGGTAARNLHDAYAVWLATQQRVARRSASAGGRLHQAEIAVCST